MGLACKLHPKPKRAPALLYIILVQEMLLQLRYIVMYLFLIDKHVIVVCLKTLFLLPHYLPINW